MGGSSRERFRDVGPAPELQRSRVVMVASDAFAQRGERADPVVDRLAEFFRSHPVWQRAAGLLDRSACSRVTFTHRPGEEWRLVRDGDRASLELGRAKDPDLAFEFTPGAVERITEVEGDVSGFAIALFTAALDSDPERRLRLEVLAPFARLLRRGYVRLLWAGGGPLLAFGSRHGIRTMRQLRDLVAGLNQTK